MRITVLIADDHAIVRQGLRALLEREGLDVVGEAADGKEAIRLAQKLRPDVAVLDLTMPFLSGADAARKMRTLCPRTKTIILTVHAEDHFVLQALQGGVSGYVLKTKGAADLVHAIEEVSKGMVYLSPDVSHTVVAACLAKDRIDADPLTSREHQVLELIANGNTTKEIAAFLDIGFKTAVSHRTRIMEKLSIHNTAGLVRYAIRRGMVQA
jgi:two-component system, NarL family, response regulator NreC